MGNPYNMSTNDYERLAQNKRLWEQQEDKESDAAKWYASENDKIRQSYGITEDNYTYNQLQALDEKSARYRDNESISQGKSLLSTKRSFSDPYSAESERLYQAMKNFDYNPDNDIAYRSYKDRLNRESQSAQDQTISNLTAISGGRNNSWASAVVGQVGQAYAQKATDAISDYADRAYNRLYQQYQMNNERSQQDYSRWNDQYNRDIQRGQSLYNMGRDEQNVLRQQWQDEWTDKLNTQTYDQTEWQNLFDRYWKPKMADLDWGKGNAELYALNENNKLLPEMNRAQLESLLLGNDNTRLQNEWFVPQIKAQIASYYNKGTGGGGSGIKLTESDKKRGTLNKIVNYIYDVPNDGSSSLYYPFQTLINNRSQFYSDVGDSNAIDSLILNEASKIAKAEGVNVNLVLSREGLDYLAK